LQYLGDVDLPVHSSDDIERLVLGKFVISHKAQLKCAYYEELHISIYGLIDFEFTARCFRIL
jgi:hypothetical protein